jgi:hypothetical protein
MPQFHSNPYIPRALLDLTRNTIGEWFVIKELPRDPVFLYRRRWLCLCSCGKNKVVLQSGLLSGRSLSCGHERRQQFAIKSRKHGLRRSPIYMRWWSMLRRCYDPRTRSYPRYGKRGISVCEGWHDFETFFAAMGHPPEGMSLDRIDNDGNYSCGKCSECLSKSWPMNLRWADKYQQGENTSQTRFLTVNGIRKPVTRWARETNLKSALIRLRIDRLGWTEAQAIGLEPPPLTLGRNRNPKGQYLPKMSKN